MATFCVIRKHQLFKDKAALKEGIISGFFQLICSVGLFKALQFLPGPLVIIILFSHTLMLLFFMAWRKEIKLNPVVVSTTVIALVGLTLVLDLWHVQKVDHLIGIAFALAAALATVGRMYVWNSLTRLHHPLVIGAEGFIFTAIFSLGILFFDTPHLPVNLLGWEFVILGGVASAIGSFGMFYGISLLGSFQWSLFSKLEPVFTSIFSALLLNEILKTSQYFGILVVASSLVAYQAFAKRK